MLPWIALITLLILSAALRFYRIDAQSLWYDEGNSARIAERSVRLIIEGAAGDIHPPLYYLLLKLWRAIFGGGEAALRSLSALAGVGTVALTFLIGREGFNARVAVMAAFVAAISPFAVYYGQEARMYALLAFAATLSTWALLPALMGRDWSPRRAAVYVLATVFGLYTQYAFPFVMVAQGVCFVGANAAVTNYWRSLKTPMVVGQSRWLRYILANLIAIALFAPWLPIALRQIRGWAVAPQDYQLGAALLDCLRWIVVGRTLPQSEAWLALIVVGVLALIGLLANRRQTSRSTSLRRLPPSPAIFAVHPAWLMLVLFALPLALLFIFKLYRDAYLKFLLVCVPPLALMVAQGMNTLIESATLKVEKMKWSPGLPRPLFTVYFLVFTFLFAPSLTNLYFNPAYARDDYRGIAQQLLQDKRDDDAVLFLAPNQWEVFTYYWTDVDKAIPLTYRPSSDAEVDAQMHRLMQGRARLFVLYYAEREADPNGWYERWLAANAFKADQQWIGNIRLAVYHAPQELGAPDKLNALFGGQIGLELAQLPPPVRAKQAAHVGDVLPFRFVWRTQEALAQNYKVFIHIGPALVGAVATSAVAQTDGEPVAGDRPTASWQPNEPIIDAHAVWLKPDTPPGTYPIWIGLYDPQTNQRLKLADGADRLQLGVIEIER